MYLNIWTLVSCSYFYLNLQCIQCVPKTKELALLFQYFWRGLWKSFIRNFWCANCYFFSWFFFSTLINEGPLFFISLCSFLFLLFLLEPTLSCSAHFQAYQWGKCDWFLFNVCLASVMVTDNACQAMIRTLFITSWTSQSEMRFHSIFIKHFRFLTVYWTFSKSDIIRWRCFFQDCNVELKHLPVIFCSQL